MILKFLLPLTVIAIVYFVGRSHAAKSGDEEAVLANSQARQQVTDRGKRFQLAAYGLAIAVFGLAGWYIYQDYTESQIMVRIRVINAETGQVVLYDAPKGLVYGRHFTTADGRRVTLADVERMEVQPVE